MDRFVYFLFRRRTFVLAVVPVVLLVLARPTPKSLLVGLPLVLVGEAIRVWSAGYLSKLSVLTTAGPFALCRNPLYIGSFVLTVGYLVMCNRLDVAVGGLIVFWMFHGGAVAYEEKLLQEKFGQPFVDYCRKVPRFVPWPRSLRGEGSFSFRKMMGNDEYRAVLATAVMIVLFALRTYWLKVN